MGRKPITKEEFENRIKCMFFGKYTLVGNFENIKTKVTILCPEHGQFEIIPRNMLYKKEECKFCGLDRMAKSKSLTNQEFISRANKIHKNIYDYSLIEYYNGYKKVKIICKKCGNIFEQRPNNHLYGQGCPYCKNKRVMFSTT